jgi:hypothetical protein
MKKGEAWGSPERASPDLVVAGGDHDLAAALAGTPHGVLVAFAPSSESDLARAIGLQAGAPPQHLALPMDALELEHGGFAVNAIVLGVAPDRLTALHASGPVSIGELVVDAVTTVVVATGQWLRGLDLVPRGHPGDGKAEIQAYRLRRPERRAMRGRLATGTHVPHPRIVTRTAVAVEVRARRALPLEIDGRPAPPVATLRAVLIPARYRLLL